MGIEEESGGRESGVAGEGGNQDARKGAGPAGHDRRWHSLLPMDTAPACLSSAVAKAAGRGGARREESGFSLSWHRYFIECLVSDLVMGCSYDYVPFFPQELC